MTFKEQVIELLEMRREDHRDNIKEHGRALNTIGASYDIGSFDESTYILEQVLEIKD